TLSAGGVRRSARDERKPTGGPGSFGGARRGCDWAGTGGFGAGRGACHEDFSGGRGEAAIDRIARALRAGARL
ncbi:MAG TPA: hypothetical protein P5214_09150, partial [Rectinema sp.]|nr:hypothetical protein [Rectinema sp.]